MSAFITVAVDDQQLRDRFDRLRARATDLRVVMGQIGEFLTESTRHRFSTRLDPEGNAWLPVSPAYAKVKAAGLATSEPGDAKSRDPARLLFLAGQLHDGIAYQAGSLNVTVGSPEKYAAVHQFGFKGIPARPYLGVSKDDLAEVCALLEDHLIAG